jgi:hypothetical protein
LHVYDTVQRSANIKHTPEGKNNPEGIEIRLKSPERERTEAEDPR